MFLRLDVIYNFTGHILLVLNPSPKKVKQFDIIHGAQQKERMLNRETVFLGAVITFHHESKV